jgi:hypothetical protein
MDVGTTNQEGSKINHRGNGRILMVNIHPEILAKQPSSADFTLGSGESVTCDIFQFTWKPTESIIPAELG